MGRKYFGTDGIRGRVGDLVRHPLFPGRNIYVVAREVDFVDRCVNVWLDELPGSNADAPDERDSSPFPDEPGVLGD